MAHFLAFFTLFYLSSTHIVTRVSLQCLSFDSLLTILENLKVSGVFWRIKSMGAKFLQDIYL